MVDANLPRSVTALPVSLGHRAELARDVGLAAAPDEEIAARAQAMGAALGTHDLDFADVRQYPPHDYAGIIVRRLPGDAVAEEIVQVLERFLREPSFLGQVSGRLAIVEEDRTRFRPPLDSSTES